MTSLKVSAGTEVRLLLSMAAAEQYMAHGMATLHAITNASRLHHVDALELSLLLAQKREAVLAARVALTAPAPAGEGEDGDTVAPAQGEPAP